MILNPFIFSLPDPFAGWKYNGTPVTIAYSATNVIESSVYGGKTYFAGTITAPSAMRKFGFLSASHGTIAGGWIYQHTSNWGEFLWEPGFSGKLYFGYSEPGYASVEGLFAANGLTR